MPGPHVRHFALGVQRMSSASDGGPPRRTPASPGGRAGASAAPPAWYLAHGSRVFRSVTRLPVELVPAA